MSGRPPRSSAWSGFWLLVLALAGEPALASPQSRALVREGAAEMAAGRHEAALAKFVQAERADPSDGEAAFFRAAALNRLDRPAEALTAIQRAVRLRARHPDVAFEAAWAFLEIGQAQRALTLLDRYEGMRPGRGATSLLRGRAYLALNDFARAEAAFHEAMRRDPALAAVARYHLAQSRAARDDLPGARTELDLLVRQHPDAPITRTVLRELAGEAPPARPWRVLVAVSGGWNSNVLAIGDGVPLPGDVTGRSSPFVRFNVNAEYDWALGPRDTLTPTYAFRADVYSAIGSANLVDNYGALTWRHRFSPDWAASLRGAIQYSLIGGRPFRLQGSARVGLAHRFSPWLTGEASYTFAVSDYIGQPATAQLDRDSITHAPAIDAYLAIPGTALRARIGIFYLGNKADGNDYDYNSAGFLVGVSHPLPFGILGEVVYARSFDRYEHPNSLAGPIGFAFRRSDDIDRVAAQLVRPLTPWLRAYVRYDYTQAQSNIRFFDYRQHAIVGGLVFHY